MQISFTVDSVWRMILHYNLMAYILGVQYICSLVLPQTLRNRKVKHHLTFFRSKIAQRTTVTHWQTLHENVKWQIDGLTTEKWSLNTNILYPENTCHWLTGFFLWNFIRQMGKCMLGNWSQIVSQLVTQYCCRNLG